jgi:regulator of replication initiation timing
MFSRIFCFGKKKQALPAQEKEGSLLLKDFSPEKDLGVRSFDAQVVPLRSPENEAALKKKKESSELFSEAVNKLVDKLEGINSNLDRQIQQNEQLVLKMETLPELLGSLPQAVDRQERIFDEISLQLRQKMAQDEKTATELSGIHEKVTACAEMDAKMSEHFGAFTRSLTKLERRYPKSNGMDSASQPFVFFKRAVSQGLFGQAADSLLLAIWSLFGGFFVNDDRIGDSDFFSGQPIAEIRRRLAGLISRVSWYKSVDAHKCMP